MYLASLRAYGSRRPSKSNSLSSSAGDYDRAAFNLMIYPGLGDISSILGGKASKTISIKPTGFPTAFRDLLTELLPRLNNRLTGSGSTIGNPAIKPGKIINLLNLGSQFSGLYRITSTTHTFDSKRL